jgi:hypothetical protein
MEIEILFDIIRTLVNDLRLILRRKRLTNREKTYLKEVVLSLIRVTAISRYYFNLGLDNPNGKENIRNQFLDLFNKLNSEINLNQEFFSTELIYGIRDKSSSFEIAENLEINNSLPVLLPILNEIDEWCDNIIIEIS